VHDVNVRAVFTRERDQQIDGSALRAWGPAGKPCPVSGRISVNVPEFGRQLGVNQQRDSQRGQYGKGIVKILLRHVRELVDA
jgi:hypothetical protein